MSIQIVINKGSNSKLHLNDHFYQDIITIGRDQKNTITLEDRQKTVSRIHAEIKYDSGIYYLIDNESSNGTFINSKKLISKKKYELHNDTLFRIGEYKLKCIIHSEESQIDNDINGLISFLERVNHRIIIDKTNSYRKQLSETIDKEMNNKDLDDIVQFLVEKFDTTATIDNVPAPRSSQMLELFIQLFTKLIQVSWKFRTEFVGSTIIQSKENKIMLSSNLLMDYLFSNEITLDALKQRINFLKSEIDKTILHHVALLDGYRSSVTDGTHKLLDECNPAKIQEEIKQSYVEIGPVKIPNKLNPLYVIFKSLKVLQNKYIEFISESPGVLEKKYFRPPFIKTYLKTINVKTEQTTK